MICKNCGGETANVFCDHCGINAVWYNKYGILQNIETPEEFIDTNEDSESKDIENLIEEVFIPDGSGD